MTVVKVLFVCLGNICRSPLAEAVFKHKINEKRLSDYFFADSCGTSNYHIGDNPDPRTIENATRNGVKIDHCGRQITTQDLEDFDLILVMDNSNFHNVMKLSNAREHAAKIKLMREFDVTDKGGEVPDPYYGGPQGFQEVFDILDRSMEELITFLQQQFLAKA